MKTLKRILCALAALASIALVLGVFAIVLHHDPGANGSGGGEEKYMFLEQVDTRFAVASNGELEVSELLSYDLGSDAWHGLYQDIILANDEQVESVDVTRIENGQAMPLGPGSGIELGVGGAYGTYGYGIVQEPRRLRIVWNVNDTGSTQFLVRYRLRGAVKNHRDVSSLLWDVWGTGWDTGVGRLNVAVVFPRRITSVHPRTDGFASRVTEPRIDGRTAQFSVRDVPAREWVQMQVVAAPLHLMPKEDSDLLPALVREQARIDAYNAERAQRSQELRDKPFWWFALWALGGALLGLLAVYLIYLLAGRDTTRFVAAGGSYQYPPEKIPAPVVANALGGAEQKNLVSATLLSLLRRDVFRVLPSETKKEDIAIANNVGESTYNAAGLAAWEVPIADLLQSAIDDHPNHAPDFTKLKKHLSPTKAEAAIDKFDKQLSAAMPQFELKRTYRGYLRRTLFCVLAGAIYVLALIMILGGGGNDAAARWDDSKWALVMAGFAATLFWAAIEGNAFYRLKPEQAERVRKWETYKDFFAQMDLSREYPLTVEIWDEALIYAAAFGCAKKVITNMPRTTADGGLAPSTGLAVISSNTHSVAALSSMTAGIGAVTGMASASSSSGGGSSGGSSGGGGGGGW